MSEQAVPGAADATVPPGIDVSRTPPAGWDAFVTAQPGASIYLRSGWSQLAFEVFGHQTFFLSARDSHGAITGVLPLVQQRGLLGNFVTSIPYFNYGGALSADDRVVSALMERARELARTLKASYLELRDVLPRSANWIVRTDKVSMILDLPDSTALLSKQLGSKLRSQIKRAERETVVVRSGGAELLDGFYEVFCRNMRDLGTPVYPKRFFRAILDRFPQNAHLLLIERQGVPAAGGFLIIDGERAEIPWASCRADLKPLGINMKLYWEVLTFVMARGCRSFDFGRSTADSGTYRFKQQWGAQPLQLHWHRWEKRASATEAAGAPASEGRFMRMATATWRRMPLPLANTLGPLISPGLPW